MFLSLACHNAEFTRLRGHLPTALEDTNTEHRLAIMQFIVRSNDCRIADSLTRHNAFYQDTRICLLPVSSLTIGSTR